MIRLRTLRWRVYLGLSSEPDAMAGFFMRGMQEEPASDRGVWQEAKG